MNKIKLTEIDIERIKRTYISHCAKFNNFEDITNDDYELAKETANKIKNLFLMYDKESMYYRYMRYLYEEFYDYHTRDIIPLTFLLTVDPNMYLYRFYEQSSKKKDVIKRAKFIFGVYDETLIKFEKKYIEKYLDINDYQFTKNLEI